VITEYLTKEVFNGGIAYATLGLIVIVAGVYAFIRLENVFIERK